MERSRLASRLFIGIGLLMIMASAIGMYMRPDKTNMVESARGTITQSSVAPADGGKYTAGQRAFANLTVEFSDRGRRETVSGSVPTSMAIAERLYGVGDPIDVYIRRSGDKAYATLTAPKPIIKLWIGMGASGLLLAGVAWLVGPTVRRSNISLQADRER